MEMPLSEEDENFRGQSSHSEEPKDLTVWTRIAPRELQQQGTEPAPGAPEKVVAGQSSRFIWVFC